MIDYITSDLHLGHENIIEYCNRPFDSLEEMNQTLITNWNQTISPSDKVLFLGDLAMAPKEQAINYFRQLNGNITFIRGNHDGDNLDETIQVFETVTFKNKGIRYICSHYPKFPPTENHLTYNLHGHTHNNETDDYPFWNPNHNTFNFSVELTNYRPVPFSKINEFVTEQESHRMETFSKQ